jgi:ElaB/YqjD/DUF883 family membrane-anchored ribosome-binding protein
MPRHTRRRRSTPDIEDLARQIQELQSDLAGLADTIKAIGSEQVDHASDMFSEAVENAKSSVRMTAAEARERGEQIAEDVESAITRNPLGAVLIAAGIGFLIAKLLRR